MNEPIEDLELAKILIGHAVKAMIEQNANSYINAYTENWLAHARRLGAYEGPVIGKLEPVLEAWQEIKEKFMIDLPDSPEYLRRTNT